MKLLNDNLTQIVYVNIFNDIKNEKIRKYKKCKNVIITENQQYLKIVEQIKNLFKEYKIDLFTKNNELYYYIDLKLVSFPSPELFKKKFDKSSF